MHYNGRSKVQHAVHSAAVEKLNQELLSAVKVLPQSQASSRLYKIAQNKAIFLIKLSNIVRIVNAAQCHSSHCQVTVVRSS